MKEIKIFLIKLIAVIVGVILVINTSYNLIFAEKIDLLFKILSLNENKYEIGNKIRNEAKRALKREQIFETEDKILLKKLYIKIKNELESE